MSAVGRRAKLAERLRWRIAYLLDRSQWYCWADLVTWAMHLGEGERVPSRRGAECLTESLDHRDHSCYCHKFCQGRRENWATDHRCDLGGVR